MSDQPAVLKRLAAQEEQRKLDRERKREEARDDADPRESTVAFLTKFASEVEKLEAKIKNVSSGGVESGLAKDQLEEILSEITEIDTSISQSGYFLPPYDVRQTRATIAALRRKVENVRTRALPKKRFAFSKRSKGSSSNQQTSNETTEENKVSENQVIAPPLAQRGLHGLQNEEVTVSGDDLGSEDYSLLDLDSCQVILNGGLSALHIRRLRNCKVVAGPIRGATLIEDIENCQLFLEGHQVRIHSAKDCQFYLHVHSNPIIEHSTQVGFAPLPNDKVVEKSENAGTVQGVNLWDKVDDFGWLKTTPSPNWYVIPEPDRCCAPLPSEPRAK